MNAQAELGDRVEGPEGPREWGQRQWQVRSALIVPVARIRPLKAMTCTGSIPHGGQTIAQSFAGRSESAEVNSMSELRSEDEDETLSNSQGNLRALDVLFLRYRSVLSLVAYRVLGDHKLAEDAVQRCLQSAFCNVPRFQSEGAFRSWLVRVLIDEALLILREKEWVARILGIDYAGEPENNSTVHRDDLEPR
jgi:Sigma-70 region 2